MEGHREQDLALFILDIGWYPDTSGYLNIARYPDVKYPYPSVKKILVTKISNTMI